MSSDLLTIARAGTRAARVALDVTAQNIANASTEGYVRRSAEMAEVASSGSIGGLVTSTTLSGVRVSGIVRNADAFRQAEVRRTGSDAARASAEVNGLESIEAAVEQSGVYEASVDFEASLQRLTADPTNGAMRASVLETGRALASTLNLSAKSLDAAGEGLRFEAQGGVDQVNQLAGELAKVNARLARTAGSANDQSALLDQRDTLLQKLSGQVDITTTFAADRTVQVRLGGTTGTDLVNGNTASTMAMTTAANGTIGFTVGGAEVVPAGGALAGKSQALIQLVDTRGKLDAAATGVIAAVNTAQASGADLEGNPGAPLFAGTGAADIAVVATSGNQIATAPAGSPAGSRDTGNLATLRTALKTADPSGKLDAVLFGVSSAVAGRTITRDALLSISESAASALQAQAGVDLDQEAVNLVRFQQAFAASGKIMQVANDMFDTILGIR
jgi:flagellar hook-associated protein 1 FlgK